MEACERLAARGQSFVFVSQGCPACFF